MSIRRFKRLSGGHGRSQSNKLARQLQKAHELIEDHVWMEARQLLEELNQRYPNREDVLAPLAITFYHLNERLEYLGLCVQINKLTPNDPDHRLALASAYLMNLRPMLARHVLKQFLSRWPNHKESGRAKEMFSGLEERLQSIFEEMGLSGDEGVELAVLHEESQVAMEAGKFKEGIAKTEELIRRKPDFKAAYNNLSLMQYYNGQIADAIANAERALSIKPDDFHAHSNLARYLLAEGRAEEARLYVERMKAIESGVFDKWLKQAEACATIGDDRGILDAFGGAEATGLIEKAPNGYLLCHVTAVANWRLGNEDKARTLWKKCLDLAPAFDTARENLADSRKPAGQRNGPWSFLLNHWISKQATDDLSAEAKRASKRGEKQMAPAVGRFLQKRPEVLNLLPILFERGDPSGREVAINLATWARKPETIQMLADFALSRNGPDELRMKAAHEAQAQGAPLSGTIRFWLKGEWQELRLRKTAITHEPRGEFPPEVVRLMQEAHRAMYEQDGVKGEQLLKQALELAPDTPSLLNNLALAYILQGRKEESDELVTQIFERFPDYLFAHTHMAHRRMQEGKYDEAEEMLIPLMEREVLHTTEAAAIYNALIELYLRRGNMEFAQRYFDLLEKVDPDNMNLDQWRSRLKKTRDLERFRFGLRRR